MAAAWDQLGAVREVSDELNRGRLSAEIGRTWQARVAGRERRSREPRRLAHAVLQVDGEPARKVVADSHRRRDPRPGLDAPDAEGPRRLGVVRVSARDEPGCSPKELRALAYQAIARPRGSVVEVELGS